MAEAWPRDSGVLDDGGGGVRAEEERTTTGGLFENYEGLNESISDRDYSSRSKL